MIAAHSRHACAAHADCGARRWCDDERTCKRCAAWNRDDMTASIDGLPPPSCEERRARSASSASWRAPNVTLAAVNGLPWTCDNRNSHLGACQPILGGAGGCDALCRSTLACVAWTFVRPAAQRMCEVRGVGLGPPAMLANFTAGGRCCLESSWPVLPPEPNACCDSGVLPLDALCVDGCKLPWMTRDQVDDLPPVQIDQQRLRLQGGLVSASRYPWVPVAQRQTHRLAWRAPSSSPPPPPPPSPPPPPRLAVCIAGAVRSLLHPIVWRSIEEHVLGRPDGIAGLAAPPTVFAVLGTGAEDHRARTNELPLDEQDALHTPAGAWLLGQALEALQPAAVHIVSGLSNASCGVPATGQFEKWATCVALIDAHEARTGERFDFLWKVRPDMRWLEPLVPLRSSQRDLGWLLRELSAQPKTVLTSDDVSLIAHRESWEALRALRAGRFSCTAACADHLWRWVRVQQYCELKGHLAAHGVHHVDFLGGALAHEDALNTWALLTPNGSVRRGAHASFEIERAAMPMEQADERAARDRPLTRSYGLAPPVRSVTLRLHAAASCAPGDGGRWRCWVCSAPGAPNSSAARRPMRVYSGACPNVRAFMWRLAPAGEVSAYVAWRASNRPLSGPAPPVPPSCGGPASVSDLASCVAACERCAACRAVSFSLHASECRWFRSCDVDTLTTQHRFYRTVFVRPYPSAHAEPPSLESLDGGGGAELPACARDAPLRATPAETHAASAAKAAARGRRQARECPGCAAVLERFALHVLDVRGLRDEPGTVGRPTQALVRAVGRGCARLRRAVARTGRDDVAALRFADVAFLRTRAPPNASRMAGGPLQSACEAAAASIHRLAELAEAMRVGARTDLLELLLAEWSVERAGYV